MQKPARPRRRRGYNRARELGVRQRMIALEIELHHLEVSALALDVLSAGADQRGRCEEGECGENPESNPGQFHPFSARAPGGSPRSEERRVGKECRSEW